MDSAAIGVSLAVNAVNDAPAFTYPAIFAVRRTARHRQAEPGVKATVSFAIAGGADQALFAIDPSEALRFISRRTSNAAGRQRGATSTASSSRPPTISAP